MTEADGPAQATKADLQAGVAPGQAIPAHSYIRMDCLRRDVRSSRAQLGECRLPKDAHQQARRESRSTPTSTSLNIC